jgi:hypothetical protein
MGSAVEDEEREPADEQGRDERQNQFMHNSFSVFGQI